MSHSLSLSQRESPLRRSPDSPQKNQWAYLAEIQRKKQNQVADEEKKMQDEIKDKFRQDLKQQIEQQKQHQQREQELDRIQQLNTPLPLHEKQISLFHQVRKQAVGQFSQDCIEFNNKILEKRKENNVKEKEKARVEAEKRILDAQVSQMNYQEHKRDEKNYIKNELLNANQAQQQIKRIQAERAVARDKALEELEVNELKEQQSKREMLKENYNQKYIINSSSNPVQGVFLENHLRQLEDRRSLERMFVKEYNEKHNKVEEENRRIEQINKNQTKNFVLSTLKSQIALKQENENASQRDKLKYHEFLQEKDKEVESWQQQRKQLQQQLNKEYNNELMSQILSKPIGKSDVMDSRELVLNKQLFENGASSAVPGMAVDHRRKRQLSMVSQSLGYQNMITTPDTVKMFSNPRIRYQPESPRNSLPSLIGPAQSMSSSRNKFFNSNNSSSMKKTMENYDRYDSNSPVKKEQFPSSVFVQSGRNIFG